jgi:Na+/H+-dicarboxylate symporter
MLGLIILGVLAGGLLGWYSADAAARVAWLGALFLNTLSMLVIPLLISAVITGVTSLGDVRKLGRIGGITLAYYLITLAIAVFIGLIMVNLIQPGAGMTAPEVSAADQALIEAAKEKGLTDILLSLVTTNLIAAAANTELLPLIIWSIAFGIAITTLGESGEPAARFFASFNSAMMRLVGWVMYVTPVGVFGLVAGRLAEAGGGERFLSDIQGLGLHIATVLSGLAIHFAVLLAILVLIARHPPGYLLGMLRAIMTAFATASSSATLPVTMQCARENDIDPRARRFVLPLGSTINMDGTALYEAAAAMFIAQAYGIDMSLGQQSIIFMTATLAAIGAAGIPEAGLVTLIIVLQAVGLPLEGIALLLAVDWFLDRFRTATNVWGDAVGAAVLTRYLPPEVERQPPLVGPMDL